MTVSRPHLFVAIFLTLAILVALCIMAPRMYPLHRASSARFWNAATQGTDIIYDRGVFVFGSQSSFTMNYDLPYESISESEAAADFQDVERELARRAALLDPDDFAATGYARWHSIKGWNGGMRGLFDCIDAARADLVSVRLREEFPNIRLFEFQQGLKHVARASHFYWACFLFEAIYLSAVVWFGFWPYIRRAGLRRKLLHVAAVPFFLYVPYWFGYCNSASPAFPIGGIVYPYLCAHAPPFPGNFTWEFRFLASLPPFLSVITQGRAVTFADYFTLRSSIPYQFGPVNVCFVSAILTSIVAAWHASVFALRKFRTRPLHAFPVLDVHPRDPQPGAKP